MPPTAPPSQPTRAATASPPARTSTAEPAPARMASPVQPARAPAPAVAPRGTFFDKLRSVAQGTRERLESMPRTEQSQGRPQAAPAMTVERPPTARKAAPQVASSAPARVAGPTAADLGRSRASGGAAAAASRAPEPAPKPRLEIAPILAEASEGVERMARAASATPPDPKPKPKPKLDLPADLAAADPAPEEQPAPPPDLEPLPPELLKPKAPTPSPAPAAAPPSGAGGAQLAARPAPAAKPAVEAPAPSVSPEAPPAADPGERRVDPGPSLLRSLVESATAAAFAQSSAALGVALGDAPPSAPQADGGDTLPVAATGDGTDAEIAALAARLAKSRPAPEPALDLTDSADDLPFVEHTPPTAAERSAGADDLVISAIHETDFDIGSSQMEFSGDVQVKSPRFALRSDRFIVHLKSDGSGMSYGEAIGNVYIRMQEDGTPSGHEGFAHRAIYRPDEGKLTLSGWPKIREQHKEHLAATADTQMVLYTDGRVKTLGRNRTVIRAE